MNPTHVPFQHFLKKGAGVFYFCFFFPAIFCFAQNSSCPASLQISKQDITCSGQSDGAISLKMFNSAGQLIPSTKDYSFSWNPVQNDTSELSNLQSGLYSVTVSSEFCPAQQLLTASVTILSPPALEIELCQELSAVTTVGGTNGVGKIRFSGGRPPYKITHTGPVSGMSTQNDASLVEIPGLPVGLYQINVQDSCNAITACSFTITGPNCSGLLNDNTPIVTSPSCPDNQDGQADFTSMIANTNPLSFLWAIDGVSTINPVRSNLSAQNYSVYVQDLTNLCLDTIDVVITAPSPISIEVVEVIADDASFGGSGKIKINIGGGSPPYLLSWTGASSGTQANVPAGDFEMSNLLHSHNYVITARDSKDCEAVVYTPLNQVIRLGGQAVIVFPDDMTEQERCLYLEEANVGFTCDSVPKRLCFCGNGVDSIVFLNITGESIELNSSPQTTQTVIKSDTSGIGKILEPSVLPSSDAIAAGCTYSPEPDSNQPKTHGVVVAVIDSGIEPKHPRLSGKVWVNSNEIEDNKVDEDANCITDDHDGYDYPQRTHFVVDALGHGTHVAGIIADAFPANIALKIINLKVYDPEAARPGDAIDVACAIYYAIDKGAQVINLSLGYFNREPSPMLYDALSLAEKRGVLVVISSGNEQSNIDALQIADPNKTRWPASFKTGKASETRGKLAPLKNLIVVGASDDSGKALAKTYSNWGPKLVDILAPGNIVSASRDGGEIALQGTSMSAAYVTHIAAIAKAYRPAMTPEQFIDSLKQVGMTKIDGLADTVSCGCVVNKQKMFAAMNLDPVTMPTEAADVAVVPSSFRVTLPIPFDQGGFDIPIGDGQTMYRDVEIVIAGDIDLATDRRGNISNTYTDVFYRWKYCSTNRISWNGLSNKQEPWRRATDTGNIQRFVVVYIGKTRVFGPQPIYPRN